MKPGRRILLIDDDELIVSMVARSLRKEGFETMAESESEGIIDKIMAWNPNIVLLDITLPGKSGIEILKEIKDRGIKTQVIMLTADDTAETAIKSMKLGAVDYFTKPFNMEELKIVLNDIIERERIKDELGYYRKLRSRWFEDNIIGNSPSIVELKKTADKIAHAQVPNILITGESGTGKELMARYVHAAIHGQAVVKCIPFITVNCTAIPGHLMESELFGHVKGSFTDAKSDTKGMFHLANEGSILLDEIGDMDASLQGKLLRVLEQRTIRRVGGKGDIPIDVTVIATTNRNISKAVEDGDFRKDLFYRLNAFHLHLPPLRDRSEDIIPLTGHFLSLFAKKYNKKNIFNISSAAEKLLISYEWPGNVRELKNLIERIVVLESEDPITPLHLPAEVRYGARQNDSKVGGKYLLPEDGISIDEVEKDLLSQALERTNKNKSQAAKLLDMSYDTIRYKIKKHGLE